MNNFSIENPVKIIFGKDTIKKVSSEIAINNNVLLIYGGGSIKKNGVYEQVTNALKDYKLTEFQGIEANPTFETCMKVVALIKEKNINYLLAVGGGSVIDATKFIAAAACIDENIDAWGILTRKVKIEKALPFGVVLTLSATASEMNSGGVISKASTHEKLAFSSEYTYPKFSILDPETTYTLPATQVSNGVVDAFVHVNEQYLTYPVNAMIQDKFSESILQTLVIEGPKALANPKDYDVRANLMWASTWALNGWIACGVPEDWSTHMIGHEITALCGLDHAKTLAVVLPGVMDVMKKEKGDKIVQLGKQVFGIEAQSSKDATIEKTIKAVEDFFHKMEIKTHLSEYNIDDKIIPVICERFKERGWKLGEHQNMTPEVVEKILRSRL